MAGPKVQVATSIPKVGDSILTAPDGTPISDADLLRLMRVELTEWRERAIEAAKENQNLRAIVSLLVRANYPKMCASLSYDVLTRLKAEGLSLEWVIDRKAREFMVRLLTPEEASPPVDGEPLGKVKGDKPSPA